MKRIIKFRGKTVNGNEWIYGDTISHGTIKRKFHKWFMEVSENKWKGLQDGSLGQFTGFFDANDKEIYEGDIVQYTDPKTHKNHRFHVVFDLGCFGFRNDNVTKQTTPLSGHIMTKWEVVGNMYDNPEMLKQD